MHTAPDPLPVVRTEGTRIHLADGRVLLDGIASWWTACHGYNHPHLVRAVQEQAETLPHIMFAGLTHEPAERLARRLVALAPPGLTRVFFSDSGSTSVEVALKIAAQSYANQGHTAKKKFLSFENGYHGDTMGCMSVCDPVDSMHASFNHFMPRQFSVSLPTDEYGFAEFAELLEGIHHQLAGVIIEPLVQAAGGMRFHSPDVLAELYAICKRYDLLFIADEVATGFGRTGSLFACQEAGITPDILCIGKALTGGMMTLAATLTTEAVFNAFLSDDPTKALMHGPTYMANPLACAAANASLDLFETDARLAQVERIETTLHSLLQPLRRLPGIREVRVKGAIGVVEWQEGAFDARSLRPKLVEQGVWLRPFGKVLYIMPAFTITDAELERLVGAMERVLTSSS
jgi:adenosylmethionine-8-amino-7-oxononanoate aminotransferase